MLYLAITTSVLAQDIIFKNVGEDEDYREDCNSDQFLCPSDDTCISKDLRCDGKEDCDEGDDEFDCSEGIHHNDIYI